MGIQPGTLGGMQPVCSSCGIALCYEITQEEYQEFQKYWDDWMCDICDPDYFQRWVNERRLEANGKS